MVSIAYGFVSKEHAKRREQCYLNSECYLNFEGYLMIKITKCKRSEDGVCCLYVMFLVLVENGESSRRYCRGLPYSYLHA